MKTGRNKGQEFGQRALRSAVVPLVIGGLVACTIVTPEQREPDRNQVVTLMPRAQNVVLTYEDWVIVRNTILDYDERQGRFRMVSGLYRYGPDLVMKLKSNRFPNHFWLMRVPSVESGNHEVRAVPSLEADMDIIPLEEPPERFDVVMVVRDGKVREQFVAGYEVGWGVFEVLRIEIGVLFMKNRWYTNRVWRGIVPDEDGTWTVHMQIQ